MEWELWRAGQHHIEVDRRVAKTAVKLGCHHPGLIVVVRMYSQRIGANMHGLFVAVMLVCEDEAGARV